MGKQHTNRCQIYRIIILHRVHYNSQALTSFQSTLHPLVTSTAVEGSRDRAAQGTMLLGWWLTTLFAGDGSVGDKELERVY